MPKKMNVNFGTILTILLGLVILFEFYLIYSALYQRLNPQPELGAFGRIIRVNRENLKEVDQYLSDLRLYEAKTPELSNPNPFKYGN